MNKYAEDTLHVLFKDNSVMFSLDFGVALDDNELSSTAYAESSVVMERHMDGRKPVSLQYILQGLVVLHGVLDALLKLILETSDEDEERYLSDKVDIVRSTLYLQDKHELLNV